MQKVGDETAPEQGFTKKLKEPKDWNMVLWAAF